VLRVWRALLPMPVKKDYMANNVSITLNFEI
jgi:hypothetical protein